MVHLLKSFNRFSGRPSEAGTLTALRARSRLQDRASVEREALTAIHGAASGGLATSLADGVRRLVGEELRVLERADGKAAVAFYQKEDERLSSFVKFVGALAGEIGRAAPALSEDGVIGFEVPWIALARDAQGLVQRLVELIVARDSDGSRLELGAGLARSVVARLCKVSKLTVEQAKEKSAVRVKFPKDVDMTGPVLVSAFLGGTVLEKILLSPVTVKLSDRTRSEHMWCTGASGHGKSQLLMHCLAADITRKKGSEVGICLIDCQTDLIERVKRLKCFANDCRLLLVDVAAEQLPALNLFDLGGTRLSDLPERERELAMARAVELVEFVVSGLFVGGEMTDQQSVAFKYLSQLMLLTPGATLETLQAFLEDSTGCEDALEQLPQNARNFFAKTFESKAYGPKRQQIANRLYAVTSDTFFTRLFGASENRLDMGRELDRGRVILCNTSKAVLGEKSKAVGRYFVALCLKAAMDRGRVAEAERRQGFVYLDEAADLFGDDNLGEFLIQARKYRVGLVLAHQSPSQMSTTLADLARTNTAIKLSGGASSKDARSLAEDMHCSPDFLLSQVRQDDATHFATYVRNVTPAAVSWRVPLGTLDRMPTMTDDELAAVVARSRGELSV